MLKRSEQNTSFSSPEAKNRGCIPIPLVHGELSKFTCTGEVFKLHHVSESFRFSASTLFSFNKNIIPNFNHRVYFLTLLKPCSRQAISAGCIPSNSIIFFIERNGSLLKTLAAAPLIGALIMFLLVFCITISLAFT